MHEFGSMDVLKIEEVPVPTISSNQVTTKIHSVLPISKYKWVYLFLYLIYLNQIELIFS